ncbi:curli assembly protein CsgF [uncultured Dokdonia sp.]|uniref:curli assembly protein CsgF n=1 Tax=uncultured Dokdonia sp. TaxID=575653 RepID=UPI00260F9661|nr:curli assembly protein CsgF [uncultured Dokdonia sp.]
MKTTIITLFITFVVTSMSAQQFVYRPINPFFGGDTFNYQQLLGSAQAQNGFTAPQNATDQQSDLERFGDNLNNQILSQISRTLTQQQLDSIGQLTEPGTFTFGTLAVEVFESGEGLIINILDTTNGEETQVIVPN